MIPKFTKLLLDDILQTFVYDHDSKYIVKTF